MPTSVGVYAKVATAIEWIGNVVNGDYVAPVEESWTIPTWTDWSFTDFWIFGTTSQPTWMDDLHADHQLVVREALVECVARGWSIDPKRFQDRYEGQNAQTHLSHPKPDEMFLLGS